MWFSRLWVFLNLLCECYRTESKFWNYCTACKVVSSTASFNWFTVPPYSLDISPPDLFMIPKHKVTHGRLRFTDFTHFQAAVTQKLESCITGGAFKWFQLVKTHSDRGPWNTIIKKKCKLFPCELYSMQDIFYFHLIY